MRRFYAWTLDLHLYFGLFLCPFILIFAISTILLNHPSLSAPETEAATASQKKSIPIEVPDNPASVEQARTILRQLNVTGEIDYVRHNAKAGRLLIPVSKPGETTKVEVDLRAKTATVEQQERGLGAALNYLHKMPGPHNVKMRGNWVYMRGWGVVADFVVYGVLFLTVSGLYLWWVLKAERAVGWVLLSAGACSVAVLVTAICTA